MDGSGSSSSQVVAQMNCASEGSLEEGYRRGKLAVTLMNLLVLTLS